ncbi:MAG: vitamin B12-dependent ribonucleotide reductase [Proteobacteria bacterium]|nr:vitamin B12-dependent ribonucleotide reductase [Pseudomonadota bacterium]
MSANLEIETANTKLNKIKKSSSLKEGLEFKRFFSIEGLHPYDAIEWEFRKAKITNEKGETVFEQENVEVPKSWSQMATNVVVSKYFRGSIGTPERESSVRQLISRVADTMANWGRKDGYFTTLEQYEIFKDELTAILVNQFAAFNSPVWFNVGVEEHPQCSACFILSVNDTMDSLLDLQKAEGMLFKYGSGAGSNLSTIRSSKELLSGGGIPSGPVSFMKGFDSWAGTIKSGGKTRRAAKMQILNVEHPDIMEFVNSKWKEEQKAWALIEQGYNGGFNVPGGAYDSVFFQNSNLSVRVTDEFMQAVVEGKKHPTRRVTDNSPCEYLDARELMKDIAHGTWICGDPGLQFDSIINDWHTCPNSGRINASNPCSEYMHLDDSACNLASINLLKYLNDDGTFDVEKYLHTVDILITAQDIAVDNASYPTEKIGVNAKAFRQLGLGFANLGALLMSLGFAYDSDEGRSLAATVMSLLCGEAYLQSARISEKLGPFAGYHKNRKEMLRVIKKHTDAADKLPKLLSLDSLTDEAKRVWHEALEHGELHGIRNSQATVLAPTGTIAFLMDCDTTGIEPDIALVKYKKLVGGGMLKIVNQSVPRALECLGYNQTEIEAIVKYIDENDTIEGAPELKHEHLSVFDCAFKAMKGERSINYMGHIKMMAACQPFVSGAISKTVNLPEHATEDDIFDAYVESWRLGLKAVAIYRDNSKRSQPLATKRDDSGDVAAALTAGIDPTIKRRRLSDERHAITHKFNIAGHEGYITVGLYDDGSPGEIFIVMAKEGSTLSGVMDAFATSISLALQYGVPLTALIQKFSHMRFEPSGFTNNKQIPYAKSFLDYIFRWLAAKFLTPEEQTAIGVMTLDQESAGSQLKMTKNSVPLTGNSPENSKSVKAIGFKVGSDSSSDLKSSKHEHGGASGLGASIAFQISDDAPPCTTCGSSMMVRQGACYRCLNCGSQGGCG